MVLFSRNDNTIAAFPPPYQFTINAHEKPEGGYEIVGTFRDHNDHQHMLITMAITADSMEDADDFAASLTTMLEDLFRYHIADRKHAIFLDIEGLFRSEFDQRKPPDED